MAALPQVLIAISIWLHSLATAVLIGHFILLRLIYVPALARTVQGTAALAEIMSTGRRWIYTSLIVFAVTGFYLMLVDVNYLGLGNFGNAWGILMLTKHLIIFGMIALDLRFAARMRRRQAITSGSLAQEGFGQVRQFANLMGILGAVVLLLTAAAQLE